MSTIFFIPSSPGAFLFPRLEIMFLISSAVIGSSGSHVSIMNDAVFYLLSGLRFYFYIVSAKLLFKDFCKNVYFIFVGYRFFPLWRSGEIVDFFVSPVKVLAICQNERFDLVFPLLVLQFFESYFDRFCECVKLCLVVWMDCILMYAFINGGGGKGLPTRQNKTTPIPLVQLRSEK